MPIGLGQPIDLCDIETQLANRGQSGRSGWGACGKDLNLVVEVAPFAVFGVYNHVQHNWRTAEMADPFICDTIINGLGGNVAATDDRAAQKRHHPSVVPAVAVE